MASKNIVNVVAILLIFLTLMFILTIIAPDAARGPLLFMMFLDILALAIIVSRRNKQLTQDAIRQEQERARPRIDQEQIGQQQSKPSTPSRTISSQTRMYVWRRDGGRCVECGSKEKLEYDHIIPVAKGGSNTERNVQLLCEHCNRTKHANIR